MRDYTTPKNKAKTRLLKLAVVFIWLIVWQGVYLIVGHDLLLASPLQVIRRVVQLGMTAVFYETVVHSLFRILLGFLLGVLGGTVIGALTASSRFCYQFFSLPLSVMKSTPVASFVILAFIWITGANISVFISFLMVLPIVWTNVDTGIRSTDPQLLELAKVYRIGTFQTIRHIVVPAVLPYFLSAVRMSLGFAWKSGIAGEVIAIPNGTVGTALYQAKVYMQTADVFAWTLVIILLSMLLEKGMLSLLELFSRKFSHLTQGEAA